MVMRSTLPVHTSIPNVVRANSATTHSQTTSARNRATVDSATSHNRLRRVRTSHPNSLAILSTVHLPWPGLAPKPPSLCAAPTIQARCVQSRLLILVTNLRRLLVVLRWIVRLPSAFPTCAANGPSTRIAPRRSSTSDSSGAMRLRSAAIAYPWMPHEESQCSPKGTALPGPLLQRSSCSRRQQRSGAMAIECDSISHCPSRLLRWRHCRSGHHQA